MEPGIVTTSRAGAHFRRTGEDRPPVFVPSRGGGTAAPEARIVHVSPGGASADRAAARRRGLRLYRNGRWRDLADLAEDLDRAGWERSDRRLRVLARLLAGHAALESGRLPFARMRFESVAHLPVDRDGTSARQAVRAARVGLGRTALARSAAPAALRHFRAARSGPGTGDDGSILTAAHRGIGSAWAEMGCPDSAAAAFSRALERARRHEDHLQTALALAALTRVELARSDPGADRRLVRLTAASADLAGGPLARIEALRARAAGRAADGGDGRRTEALGDLRKALAVALHTDSVLRQARIERDLARTLEALGRPEEAEARRSRARDLLGRQGPRP